MKEEKRSKCTLCLKEITTEEFLKYNHRCKKCNKKPNFRPRIDVKCTGCRHRPHKEVCNEAMATSGFPHFKVTQLCGCFADM